MNTMDLESQIPCCRAQGQPEVWTILGMAGSDLKPFPRPISGPSAFWDRH